jgi:hypothetical protein
MKCPNCPILGAYCAGFDARRFCQLLDPQHGAYRPQYAMVVAQLTDRHNLAQAGDAETPASTAYEPPPREAGTPAPCCGGANPLAL